MEHNDIKILIRYNFGVKLLTICFNYDLNSTNYDECHVNSGIINGTYTDIIYRTYYP